MNKYPDKLYIIIDKAAERTFCRLAFYSSCRFAQTLFRQTPSGTVYPSSMSQTRPPQSGGGAEKGNHAHLQVVFALVYDRSMSNAKSIVFSLI